MCSSDLDVAREISEKLIRRHPHVFEDPDDKEEDADAVIDRWEKIKAEEKKARGEDDTNKLFKELPPQLPATLHADKFYKQICKLGLQSKGGWDEAVVDQLAEGLDESRAGRVLFEYIAACRKAGIDPESALRKFTASQIKKLEDSKLG